MNLDRLREELERDEGLRLKPYKCTAGKLTIGYGRNLDDRGISIEEARLLLQNDIAEHIALLDKHLPWWRERLDGVRQRVLANMAFNLGVAKLLTFRNTLRAMERGDYEAAARGMEQSLWARQVGERAERLADMMRMGGE